MTPIEYFSKKYIISDTGCWLWTASKRDGYGKFGVNGRSYASHRWAYEYFVGKVPDGLVLDHYVCDNRACVNPEHLRPVTNRENVLRGTGLSAVNSRKTHCGHGHAFDKSNTGITYRDGRPVRHCKRCNADSARRRYHRCVSD